MTSLVLTKLKALLAPVPTPILAPLLTVALVGVATWLAVRYLRGFRYDMATLNKIPGPKPLPVVGNAWELAVDHVDFIKVVMEMIGSYGNVVKLFLGHRPYVVLSGAKGYETVLSSNRHITKGPDYR